MKRAMVAEVMTTHALSQRRACGLIGITRRSLLRAAAEDRNVNCGSACGSWPKSDAVGVVHALLMLRREGWCANHKRVERLYRQEGLSLRQRRRRKRLSHLRVVRERPVAANQTGAVDFIHDSLMSGWRFRAFAVLDKWSRESLAIEVDVSLTCERLTRVLERLHTMRGLPSVIQAGCATGCSTSGPMIMKIGYRLWTPIVLGNRFCFSIRSIEGGELRAVLFRASVFRAVFWLRGRRED